MKIADLTNPILQPWAREQIRKANEEVLAGKVGFTARARCKNTRMAYYVSGSPSITGL